MAAGAPWSVKGIDPKAREVAKELARRSGMTLGEWLTHVILEDDVPEEVSSQADLAARPARGPPTAGPRSAGAPEDLGRVIQALDRLTGQIEEQETRAGLAIAGIEHSVREAVARIETAEREQLAVAGRLESLAERLDTAEARPRASADVGPRSMEALRALYGDEVQIPEGRDSPEVLDEIMEGLGERLAAAEARTSEALEALRGSLADLDARLGGVEAGGAAGLDRKLEALAHELEARLQAVRADAAAGLGGAGEGSSDRRFAELGARVAAAEAHSARAIDRMGREVLALAEALNRRLQEAESRSAAAVELAGGEVARLGVTVENRLARAEQAQAEALERLGEEIARGAERLTDRVIQSERRTAQAIEDVGEQVARVTERMEHRHERLADDLAERLRESEVRTARLLEEAREKLEARVAGARGRLTEALAEPPATGHPFGPGLFARIEEVPDEPEPPGPPVPPADLAHEADEFIPLAELDEDAFLEPEPPSADSGRPPLSTREVIAQARIAARAAAGPQVAAPERRAPRAGRRMFRGFGFRSQLRPTSTWHTALMVAGGAAFLSVGAAGVVLMEGPGPTAPNEAALKPQPAAPGPAPSTPRAAVALGPGPLATSGPAPAAPAAEAPPSPPSSPASAAAYAAAIHDLEGGQAGALARLRDVAQSGYAPAQFYLAKLYESGQYGVVRNVAEARRWTEAAAEGGDRSAMHNLALYYFRGEGGPLNLATAAAWFRRAAEAGVVDSQFNLGLLYQSGSGVRRDEAEAYKWFAIAAAGGDGQARANALALEPRLSPGALAAAERAVQASRARTGGAAQAGASEATDVVGVQRILGRLGYYGGPQDGRLSPGLRVAIAAYQRDHGLPASGALDAATATRLAVFAR